MAWRGPRRSRHEARDRSHGAAVVHELAEQRAEQEQGKELRQELRGTSHECLRPMGEQRLPRKGGREKRRGGRQQENAPAAIGEPDQQSESDQDAQETHRSALRQQHVEIGGRAVTDVVADARRGISLAARRPSSRSIVRNSRSAIHLRGRAEVDQHIAHDSMRAHSRPTRALACPGIGHLAHQRDHAQLLHQCGVEGDLVQAIEDLAR